MNPFLISHRGNINGPDPTHENDPIRIREALNAGFQVEIDVWKVGSDIKLGHDSPKYIISIDALNNPLLWCHAKNIEALHTMLLLPECNCFWHETDRATITSHGMIWHYPTDHNFTYLSVCVLPEQSKVDDKLMKICYGICSDYIEKYKYLL